MRRVDYILRNAQKLMQIERKRRNPNVYNGGCLPLGLQALKTLNQTESETESASTWIQQKQVG